MKKIINRTLNIITVIFMMMHCNHAVGQDSLSIEQLKPLTHIFSIENGVLTGEGATFLRKEMHKAQFTLIGEYHGSKRISEFTEAIIPILDSAGYKTLVAEVGPTAGRVLNQLNGDVHAELRSILEKYKLVEDDGYVNPPFPFFEHIEDANFLAAAKRRNWNIFGIDQEYYYCHQMLIDLMFDQLSKEAQIATKALYQRVSDSIAIYNQLDLDGERDLAISIKASKILQDFVSTASSSSQNLEIAEALYASNNIYWLYAQRQWFENNATRIRYMKAQLSKQLEENGFNLGEDKLAIKMGGYHLSKGFSPLGLYEVGNTLNEMAEFHGNTTLNIAFSSRFYVEEGKEMDVLSSSNKFRQRLRDLNQLGRKEEWVVIDLRPMIKGHFYMPVKYKFNEHVEGLIKRYDLLVIPKMEMDPTPNYKED